MLEDLDALIDSSIRSYFLNELDGLINQHGVLLIATTNHPERLDPALLKRPSRFDSKMTFDHPDRDLRRQFLAKWLAERVGSQHLKFDPPPSPSHTSQSEQVPTLSNIDQLTDALADRTQGWSFALLKELFISFLLAFAAGQLFNPKIDEQSDPLAAVPYWKLIEHATLIGGDALAPMYQPTNEEEYDL